MKKNLFVLFVAVFAIICSKGQTLGAMYDPEDSIMVEQLLQKAESEPDVMALLRQTDILIDGPFILEQRNLDLKFRGSDNQRVIDVPRSLHEGTVIPFEFE